RLVLAGLVTLLQRERAISADRAEPRMKGRFWPDSARRERAVDFRIAVICGTGNRTVLKQPFAPATVRPQPASRISRKQSFREPRATRKARSDSQVIPI